jgi:hypothetical protein
MFRSSLVSLVRVFTALQALLVIAVVLIADVVITHIRVNALLVNPNRFIEEVKRKTE